MSNVILEKLNEMDNKLDKLLEGCEDGTQKKTTLAESQCKNSKAGAESQQAEVS